MLVILFQQWNFFVMNIFKITLKHAGTRSEKWAAMKSNQKVYTVLPK